MARSMSGSVGSHESGAKNLAADIRTVQELLTAVAKKLRSATFDPNGIDGKIARPGGRSGTVQAITSLQKLRVGMRNPDQRIDVNGKTWKTLVAAAGPVAKPPAVAPAALTLTVTHGGKIPTKTKFAKSTPATGGGMYESTFTLSGGRSGTFRDSIYPDDMTVKGRLVDGTYPLHIGFHKGGSAAKQTAANLVVKTQGVRVSLLINARSSVPVQNDNPSKTTSVGVNVHNGLSGNRGSDGCLTLHPSDWSNFMQIFLDAYPNINDGHTIGNNTGKRIGKLVIKK